MFVVVGHLAYVLFAPEYQMAQKFKTGFNSYAGLSFFPLSEKQAIELFPTEDPAVFHAICPFDISNGPIQISIAPFEHYWSLGIYSQKGDNYYSINDRQSVDSKLNIIIQEPGREEDADTKLAKLVRDRTVLDAPTPKGIAVLRFQIYNRESRDAIITQVKSFTCKRQGN